MSTDGGFTWTPTIKVNATPTNIPAGNQQACPPSVHVAATGRLASRTSTSGTTRRIQRHFQPRTGSSTATPTRTRAELGERSQADRCSVRHAAGAERGGFFTGDYEGLTAVGNRFGAYFSVTHGTDRAAPSTGRPAHRSPYRGAPDGSARLGRTSSTTRATSRLRRWCGPHAGDGAVRRGGARHRVLDALGLGRPFAEMYAKAESAASPRDGAGRASRSPSMCVSLRVSLRVSCWHPRSSARSRSRSTMHGVSAVGPATGPRLETVVQGVRVVTPLLISACARVRARLRGSRPRGRVPGPGPVPVVAFARGGYPRHPLLLRVRACARG